MQRVVFELGEEQSPARVDDRLVAQPIGEAETRRDIVLVGRPAARQPRQELHELTLGAVIEIVPDAHVGCQLVADLPVVLEPRRIDLAVHRVRHVADRDLVVAEER